MLETIKTEDVYYLNIGKIDKGIGKIDKGTVKYSHSNISPVAMWSNSKDTFYIFKTTNLWYFTFVNYLLASAFGHYRLTGG